MKANKLLLLASTILAASTLAGCGGGSSDDGTIKITFDHTFGEGIEKALQLNLQNLRASLRLMIMLNLNLLCHLQ